ncbi:hypothetical protein [Acidipropionibacterium jensenii]|nr:hypothetical protein [Acidipropionibacterium jensenii]MDN6557621.1 hypothetical protein [Acidipropionibacterium acidipropionici]MDN5978641.1 hypothetical protein [Acidipropionibacterium jensenii]MDN5997550.1 hypothetical protein [Acidipropionibacterium jensenii]MDN6021546.1 hypothetical protein [Acidipropionibacterium jensenii]MDN6428198.1 hypothetical protein [Acidipropionibacterium jensenii]
MKRLTTSRAAVLATGLLLVAAVPLVSRRGGGWCSRHPWWPGCRSSK